MVVDPLDHLKAYKDSSISMMRAAARRGHRIHALEQSDIVWSGGNVEARTQSLTMHDDNVRWHDPGPVSLRRLDEFDAVRRRLR